MAAVIAGWVVSAIVTMRNLTGSIQSPRSVLARVGNLQDADAADQHPRFKSGGRHLQRTAAGLTQAHPNVRLEALRYPLNYFEFIAVGICYGDFDGKLLKNILCSIYKAAGTLVAQTAKAPDHAKGTGNPGSSSVWKAVRPVSGLAHAAALVTGGAAMAIGAKAGPAVAEGPNAASPSGP